MNENSISKTCKTEDRKKGRNMKEKIVSGVTWNVAGLKRKEEDFWEFLKDFDIIGLTETWVDGREWEKLKEKMPEGWKWRCQPASKECRKGRAKEGIITGMRVELEEIDIGYEEKEGFQERAMKTDGEKWRVVTVYNRDGNKKVLDNLKEWIKEGEEEILVLAGDFNARVGKNEGWENKEEGEDEREGVKGRNYKQARERLDRFNRRKRVDIAKWGEIWG